MRQRMLECVLRLGNQARLVQELGRLKAREALEQQISIDSCYSQQPFQRDVSANNRSGLQQTLLCRGKAIDPGSQNRLHRRRDLERLDRSVRSVGAQVADERTGVHERTNRLFEK